MSIQPRLLWQVYCRSSPSGGSIPNSRGLDEYAVGLGDCRSGGYGLGYRGLLMAEWQVLGVGTYLLLRRKGEE